MAHPDHLGFAAFRRPCFGVALAVSLLALSGHNPIHGEAGEPFVVDDSPRILPPPAVAEEPVGGFLHIARDPAGMEAARGAAWHDALTKRPVRHAGKAAQKEGRLAMPSPPPVRPAPVAPKLTDTLIHPAAAAEPGSDAEPAQVAFWRRALGSPYVAWLALVVLVGGPIFGLLRGQLEARREARDLANHD